jgi:hypothetical protein
MSNFKKFDSLETFLQAIPRTIVENLEFRIDLHTLLAKDKSLQSLYLTMCLEAPQIAFDSLFWTFNPQKDPGERNYPFILRPKQIPAVNTLHECILEGHDAGINKSRKMGASEICAKIAAMHTLLVPETVGIFGSRKKEYVDNRGDPTTLFAKIDHAFEHLPFWLKDQTHIERKDMTLNVLDTSSALLGETTNESFSAGSRGTFMVLDEFGRVLKRAADSIEGSIHDVTNCVIYSSTHWLGAGHTFQQCLLKPSTKVVNLMWYDSPDEAEGLYTSPQPGIIEVLDPEYYKEYDLPAQFNIEDMSPEVQRLFIADGCERIPGKYRSPWHDKREVKSKGNKRDFLCNVWAEPVGASDAVFDQFILMKIKENFVKEANYKGEVIFEYDDDGKIIDPEYYDRYGLKRLEWWGELPNGRPNQTHNYIIGCDPSFGLGSSNSVAGIVDANTNELVGLWSCPNTREDRFADQVIALAMWCGGVDDTFIIWESNGANGVNFGNRIIWQGWYNVYTQKTEDAKVRKRGKKYGWKSGPKTKGLLLGDLGVSLTMGVEEDKNYKSIRVYSQDLLDELFDYVFLEGGDLSASSKADLTTGARERHGDRVIAVALCVLGMKDQMEGLMENILEPPTNSFEFR